MARRYGRAPRGERVVAAIPHGHWKTTTFIAALRHDLNPIEQVFAKLKAILRKVGARTVDDLWRAIGNALDQCSPTECGNYLVNAGYSV